MTPKEALDLTRTLSGIESAMLCNAAKIPDHLFDGIDESMAVLERYILQAQPSTTSTLEATAKAVQAEREACALLVMQTAHAQNCGPDAYVLANNAALAIRRRGERHDAPRKGDAHGQQT